MVGLNANSPPPKTTEVAIKRWEYSDPVGVPHPDKVVVVVVLENKGNALSDLEVDVEGEWRQGSLQNAATSTWSSATALQTFHGIDLPSGQSKTLRIPVDIKAKMESLAPRMEWPYSLRTTVVIREGGSANSKVKSVVELPIEPGD